jgi:uncharacterized delta-60 repeat protein
MTRRSIVGALLACVVVPALVGFAAGAAGTAPGSLDGSFGKGGKTTISFGDKGTANGVALRPNGKIVLAGFTSNGGAASDFGVAQLNRDGSPDGSFGLNGHTAADFGGSETAYAVVLQPDGKIVVAGNTSKGITGSDFAVARINPNGLFDKSFGTGGRMTVDFGGNESAYSMVLRPNGKIVLAGYTSKGSTGEDIAVAQLNADGSLDGSFGVGGKTTADFGSDEEAEAVVLQPNGKIVVAGYTSKGTTSADFAVARINPNGLFDSSFGTGGRMTVDFGGFELAFGVALRPGGKMVVVGAAAKPATGYDVAIAQLAANGSLDSLFGVSGKTTADFGGTDEAYAVALQPDGKIMAVGSTSNGSNSGDFAVARINPNGLYDQSFGAGGRMTVDFGGDERAHAVLLQPDGKIVVAGETVKGTTGWDFAVARLLGGPTGKSLTAKIVSATILGHGQGRTLDVKIRVSKAARAQLRLLKQGFERLQKTFSVKSGTNELKALLPTTLQKGVYKLEISLRDAKGQRKVYRADVLVPA